MPSICKCHADDTGKYHLLGPKGKSKKGNHSLLVGACKAALVRGSVKSKQTLNIYRPMGTVAILITVHERRSVLIRFWIQCIWDIIDLHHTDSLIIQRALQTSDYALGMTFRRDYLSNLYGKHTKG